MKKTVILTVVLILVAVNFSVALAAPWNNPNGFWVENVNCGDLGTFNIWVPNDYMEASFNQYGYVGITKALYKDFGNGYELVWQVPGKGVYKRTVWCEWTLEGVNWAGDILLP